VRRSRGSGGGAAINHRLIVVVLFVVPVGAARWHSSVRIGGLVALWLALLTVGFGDYFIWVVGMGNGWITNLCAACRKVWSTRSEGESPKPYGKSPTSFLKQFLGSSWRCWQCSPAE